MAAGRQGGPQQLLTGQNTDQQPALSSVPAVIFYHKKQYFNFMGAVLHVFCCLIWNFLLINLTREMMHNLFYGGPYYGC
jgi:hypothetical protein